jgi:LysM repeat protein
MTNWRSYMVPCLCMGVVALLLSGCSPSEYGHGNEEKEAYYQRGKALVNTMDYHGAIESFEKALEVNPRNAPAHYELGLLYESNEIDYAAAIYHFNRFLKLRPESKNADRARECISYCMREMAKSISLSMAPEMQAIQMELQRLTITNRELARQVDAWRAYYAGQPQPVSPGPNVTTPSPVQGRPAGQTPPPTTADHTQTTPRPILATTNAAPISAPPARPRTHAVQSGETPSVIARKYGVKVESLLAANPGLNPRKMKVGQVLNIPAAP